jgi:hypothetical protein
VARETSSSIDAIIREAAAGVVARVGATVHRIIERTVAERVRAELASARRAAPARGKRRRRPVQMTRWVADRRARRVPNFVIEMTGLDTKKKIVARYGANAVVEKGKPLPKPVEAAGADKGARAKGPTIRRKAAAA